MSLETDVPHAEYLIPPPAVASAEATTAAQSNAMVVARRIGRLERAAARGRAPRCHECFLARSTCRLRTGAKSRLSPTTSRPGKVPRRGPTRLDGQGLALRELFWRPPTAAQQAGAWTTTVDRLVKVAGRRQRADSRRAERCGKKKYERKMGPRCV